MATATIEEELAVVSESPEEQLKRIYNCLKLTERRLPQGSDVWIPESDDEIRLCGVRLVALQHRDRLSTAIELCNGCFEQQVYAGLRNANIRDVLTDFAVSGDVLSIEVLLSRHPYLVTPFILGALDQVPETVAPQQFESIIRHLSRLSLHPPELQRAGDWVEAPPVLDKLKRNYDMGTDQLEGLTDFTWQHYRGWSAPTAHQICFWAQKRAFAVERITGQLDRAMEYFQIVSSIIGDDEMDQASVSQAGHQLQFLLRIAASRSENAWMYDLFTFQTLDDAARIEKVLTLLHADTLVADVKNILLPFLTSFGTLQSGLRALSIAFQRADDSKFPLIIDILKTESAQPQLFDTSSHLCRATLAFVYACGSSEFWPLVETLLCAVRERIHRDSCLDYDQSEALLTMLDAVEGQIFAAKVFTKHGLPTTLAQIRDASHSETVTMLRTMLSRHVRSRPSESTWNRLWEDIVAAQQRGLSSILGEEDVRIEFVRAMLRCGHLRTAKLYLSGLADLQQESLVLEGAQDAFYSSDTPDERTIQLVTQVLSLLPHSQAAQEEVSFVSAAVKLKQLGVDLPPLALRQEPNKAAIFQQAVKQASMTALLDTESFLKLSVALDAQLTEVEVLLMIAEAALEAGSHRYCETLLLRVASAPFHHHGDGWMLAYRLIKSENGCTNDQAQRQLMVYVMKYAPVDVLLDIVQCWESSADKKGGNVDFLTLDQQQSAVKEILNSWLKHNNHEATGHDCMVLVNKLLAVGPDGPATWGDLLQTCTGELKPALARYAYVAGLLAASVQALTLLAEEPGQVLQHGDQGRLVPEVYMILLEHWSNYTPLYLVKTALSGIAKHLQVSSASLDSGSALKLDKCRKIIISLAKGMESAADSCRIEQLLQRSNRIAGLHDDDFNASSQPELICHLATLLAKEKVADVDGDVTLQEIVSLGRRNGVDQYHIYQTYVVAFLVQTCCQPELRLQACMDQKAWHYMLMNKPVDVLQAIYQDVLPGFKQSNGAELLLWVLRICSEVSRACCQHLEQNKAEEVAEFKQSAAQLFDLIADAFEQMVIYLQKSIDFLIKHTDANTAVHRAIEGKLVLFAQPLFQFLFSIVGFVRPPDEQAWQDETGKLLCLLSEIMALGEQDRVDIEEILIHIIQGLSSVYSQVLHSLPGRMEEYQKFGNQTYPVDTSSVHIIALCRLLIAISASESIIGETQRQKLKARFASVPLKEAVNIAAFACLGEEIMALDYVFQGKRPSLSPDQCSVLLETALISINELANQSEGILDTELMFKIGLLRKEALRLGALSKIETKCRTLNERQLGDARELVARLQEIDTAHVRDGHLESFLSKLFEDGCSVADIFVCASACKQLVNEPDSALALTSQSAERVVQRAVRYMSASHHGSSPDDAEEWTSYSYGEAVQHVYGVIRALNDNTAANMLSVDHLDLLRSKIWYALHTYAASEHSAVNAVSAEARVQLLEMFGSLGQSMWLGWKPPSGILKDGSFNQGEEGQIYSHKNALLYSRATAILAASWQKSLEMWTTVSSDVFSDKDETERVMVQLIEAASTIDEIMTVVRVLRDVLDNVFPNESLIIHETETDGKDCGAGRELQVPSLHDLWFKSLKGLLERKALDPALHLIDRGVDDVDALITDTEAEIIISTCHERSGKIFAAAVACLLPYRGLQMKCIGLMTPLETAGGSLSELKLDWKAAQALGICALNKDLFGTLFQFGGSFLLKELCTAVLDCSHSIQLDSNNDKEVENKAALVRMGLAAAAAAALIEHSLFSAAAWVAIQHAGIHPLLRLVDSAPHVLRKLFNAAIVNKDALKSVEYEPHEADSIVVPCNVQKVLRCAPDVAMLALNKLT